MDFFYDSQIRRILLQFARIFNNIKVESAADENGVKTTSTVPIRYGDMSRMVANILQQNSENTSLPSPMFSFYIKSLSMDSERRQDPQLVSTVHATERKIVGGEYTSEPGNKYTIERHMPVPYRLTMALDVWTTSTTTKLQILEQLLTLFNPAIQLQQHMNVLDWTSIFEVIMTDVLWSTKGIPQGTESEKDIASLTFEIPIWLNPPSKVKKQKLIQTIVTQITNGTLCEDDVFSNTFSANESHIIITPNDYKIHVETKGNQTIVSLIDSLKGENVGWSEFYKTYKQSLELNSYLTLKTDDNIESTDGDVIGSVTQLSDDKLLFVVDEDTLPLSIQPVNKVIDATAVYPGFKLPLAVAGQRYLLISNLTNGEEGALSQSNPWGITANENDIIEYNGSNWFVSFDSAKYNEIAHVKNLNSGQHLKFRNKEWVYTFQGTYTPGYWNLTF